MPCYGDNTQNLLYRGLLYLWNLDGAFLAKKKTYFLNEKSTPNLYLCGSNILEPLHSFSFMCYWWVWKREKEAWQTFILFSPCLTSKDDETVRPYSSWEPQGNSESLYSPLFELLQSFMLCFLLKTVSGKWVVLFWFPPACCSWGRRPLLRGVQSVSSKIATASNGVEGLRT